MFDLYRRKNDAFVEVWRTGCGITAVWPVKKTLHGSVYTDEWFGGIAWSPDESMFLYIADRPVPKQPENTVPAVLVWPEKHKHTYNEDARDPFGEGFISRRSPAMFIGDISSENSVPVSVSKSDNDESFLFGDPQWSPDGKYIAVTFRTAIHLDVDEDPQHIRRRPYELGLRYCYNRHQAVAIFPAPKDVEQLSAFDASVIQVSNDYELDDFCCYSPRFSADSNDLLYLSFPRSGARRSDGKVLPHSACKILRTVHLAGEQPMPPYTLIPIPEKPSVDEFPGLFLHALPKQPWLDSKSLAFTSVWHSRTRIVLASLPRGENGLLISQTEKLLCKDWMESYANELRLIGCESSNCNNSMALLDIFKDCVLVETSNPATPSQICCMKLKKEDLSIAGPIALVAGNLDASKELVGGQWDIHTEFLQAQEDAEWPLEISAKQVPRADVNLEKHYQVAFVCPVATGTLSEDGTTESRREGGKLPLVVYPHGGPHSVSLHSFSLGAAALLKLGFAVLYVNYRGSIGYGQASLEKLPGKVGTQDVHEVVQATRWALNRWGAILNRDRVGFIGGSHSGFLGAHTSLIPGLYKRTVLRNPVVNIASMAGSSDIPDWCFCETQLDQKNENGIPLCPDGKQLAVMYSHSPISKIRPEADPAKRPGLTLLLVGGSDRRVPPQQSLEWKRAMTEAYGSGSVSIRWYPESDHAIDRVPDGDDSWVHALDVLRGM